MCFLNFGDDNWRQAEAWILLFAGAVEMNALAQAALRRFTQRPWIERPTFQLRGGHFITGLTPPFLRFRHNASYSGFDRLHHRRPDLHRPPTAQPTDLPPDQRASLPLPSDEVRHRWGHDAQRPLGRVEPAGELLSLSRDFSPLVSKCSLKKGVVTTSPPFERDVVNGMWQGLRTFTCGSLSFPEIYIFLFYSLFLLQSAEIL